MDSHEADSEEDKKMKISNVKTATALGLMIATGIAVTGCGSSSTERPANAAVFHTPTPPSSPKHWTKEDKIAAIKRSAMPAEQKKAEISKVESGQD